MSVQCKKVADLVADQQKDLDSGSYAWAVGELIKEMAERDTAAADLLAGDLQRSEMDIKAAGEHLYNHARKSRKGSSYAMTDDEARRLLRKFYHIPDTPATPTRQAPTTINLLDLM